MVGDSDNTLSRVIASAAKRYRVDGALRPVLCS